MLCFRERPYFKALPSWLPRAQYSELFEAAVAAHFSLDLGCSFELSGLRLPESAHPASLMRTCLQEPSGHWGSGQFVYIQASRTKKSFPTTADRHSHQMKPSSKAAISSDVHVSTVGSTQSVMWHQPAVTFSSRRDMQAPQTTLSTQVPLVWEAGFSHCPQLQPNTWDLHFNLASD